MLDDILQQFDQLLPSGDADGAAEVLAPLGDAGIVCSPADHSHAGALPAPMHSVLVLPPGSELHTHHMSLVDPLTNMNSYGFEGFAMGHQHGLIDTDGDGVFDQTCWGTPVTKVESYIRSDGTPVEGHYRTTPDGHTWNNLNHR